MPAAPSGAARAIRPVAARALLLDRRPAGG